MDALNDGVGLEQHQPLGQANIQHGAIIAGPDNGTETSPPSMPGNLRGAATIFSPDHFRFLMARHGRGINVALADGSARWVQLEDVYMMSWRDSWIKYRLHLPAK